MGVESLRTTGSDQKKATLAKSTLKLKHDKQKPNKMYGTDTTSLLENRGRSKTTNMVPQLRFRLLKEFFPPRGFLRNFSSNVLKEELRSDSATHVYKKELSKNETLKLLLDGVVHKKDGIVVTNKPYGLTPKKIKKPSGDSTEIYLTDLLPALARSLGLGSLHVLKATNRYSSGVLVLTDVGITSEIAYKQHQMLTHSFENSFWVVVVGCPIHEELKTVFALQKTLFLDKVYYEIIDSFSEKNVNRGPIKVFNWDHKVLATTQIASLVQVNVSSFEWLNIQTFLTAKCLSPILGGFHNWVSSRNIMSDLTLTKPEAPKTNLQELPPEIMSALQISQEQIKIIPSHIHLQSATLNDGNKSFTVSVPPPESFIWTCEKLGLPLPS